MLEISIHIILFKIIIIKMDNSLRRSIKVKYGDNIKRIEDVIPTFETLVNKICLTYNINLNSSIIKIYDGETEIKNTMDLNKVYQNTTTSTALKLRISVANDEIIETESIMLQNESKEKVNQGTSCNVETKDQHANTKIDVEEKECSTNNNLIIREAVETRNESCQAKEEKNLVKDNMVQSEIGNKEMNVYFDIKNDNSSVSNENKQLYQSIESLLEKKFSELQVKVNKKIEEVANKCEMAEISEFNSIENDREEENYERIPINTQCSVCLKKFTGNHFICLVCPMSNLCSSCENTHDHPTMKFKKSCGFTDKHQIFKLLQLFDEEDHKTDKGFFDGIRTTFSSKKVGGEVKFSLTDFNEIRARPGKKFVIPLLVINTCKTILPSSTLVMTRGSKDLIIPTISIGRDLEQSSGIELELDCKAKSKGTYNLEIFLFNRDVEIKTESFNIKLVVNEDNDEQDLNEYIVNPKLCLLPKEQKLILKNIKWDGISDKDFNIIYAIMDKYKWDINSAIDELTMSY
jgi:hypothetical protein